jgi:hypothetical protein
LAKAEYLDASRRRVWALTEKGRTVSLSPNAVLRLFKEVHANFPTKDAKPTIVDDETDNTPQRLLQGGCLLELTGELEVGP